MNKGKVVDYDEKTKETMDSSRGNVGCFNSGFGSYSN